MVIELYRVLLTIKNYKLCFIQKLIELQTEF